MSRAHVELMAVVVLGVSASAAATPVVLIGDSITEGTVSGPPAPGYAERLPGLLGDGYQVANAGLSGSSAVLWDPDFVACELFCPDTPDLSFYDRIVGDQVVRGTIVSILLGTNDASGFFLERRTPPGDYGTLLERLVDRVIADGAEVVILMSPPPKPSGAIANRFLEEYGGEVDDICLARPLVACGPDLFELLDVARDFTGVDVHPNASGHQRIAEALASAILAVPEPSTSVAVAIGLAMMALRRRAHRVARHARRAGEIVRERRADGLSRVARGPRATLGSQSSASCSGTV